MADILNLNPVNLCSCGKVPKYHCDAFSDGPVSWCFKRNSKENKDDLRNDGSTERRCR